MIWVCVLTAQHAVFILKYIISEAIPDVPKGVTEHLKRQVRA